MNRICKPRRTAFALATVLGALVVVSGCASVAPPPPTNHPRVVERDLGDERVADRSAEQRPAARPSR
jgi:hypothetical protein